METKWDELDGYRIRLKQAISTEKENEIWYTLTALQVTGFELALVKRYRELYARTSAPLAF